LLYDKYKGKGRVTEEPKKEPTLELDDKYRVKQLLTKSEYVFYGLLKTKCDESALLICPKVRLEDFIQVTAQEKSKYRGYIKSRHIDFLICDDKLHIKCAIELDDSSHNTKKVQETDGFKNRLYGAIKLPLFRIKTTDNYADKIDEVIIKIKQEGTR